MAYKIKLDETVESTFRRIGVEQIENARKQLIAKKTETLGVHEARKNLKKARSLLRLIRPAIQRKAFRQANFHLRDIARSMAGTRDVQAMVETVMRIKAHFGLRNSDYVISPLLKLLEKYRTDAENELAENSDAKLLNEFTAARNIFRDLEFSNADMENVLKGFAATYSRGKTNMEQAYRHVDIEAFHEWRKYLQQHWRQLQLLTPIWPEMMTAHVAQTSQISDILGNHNDLSILIDFMNDNVGVLKRQGKLKKFIELCDEWRIELREDVRPFGERAYAESPDSFADRIRIYWEMSSRN